MPQSPKKSLSHLISPAEIATSQGNRSLTPSPEEIALSPVSSQGEGSTGESQMPLSLIQKTHNKLDELHKFVRAMVKVSEMGEQVLGCIGTDRFSDEGIIELRKAIESDVSEPSGPWDQEQRLKIMNEVEILYNVALIATKEEEGIIYDETSNRFTAEVDNWIKLENEYREYQEYVSMIQSERFIFYKELQMLYNKNVIKVKLIPRTTSRVSCSRASSSLKLSRRSFQSDGVKAVNFPVNAETNRIIQELIVQLVEFNRNLVEFKRNLVEFNRNTRQ